MSADEARQQHDDHCVLYDRERIRLSDEYSPTVKKVMERFWRRIDEQERERELGEEIHENL